MIFCVVISFSILASFSYILELCYAFKLHKTIIFMLAIFVTDLGPVCEELSIVQVQQYS
jgi:hypothetical protein